MEMLELTTEYAPRRSYVPWKVSGTSSTGMLKVFRLSVADFRIHQLENS